MRLGRRGSPGMHHRLQPVTAVYMRAGGRAGISVERAGPPRIHPTALTSFIIRRPCRVIVHHSSTTHVSDQAVANTRGLSPTNDWHLPINPTFPARACTALAAATARHRPRH